MIFRSLNAGCDVIGDCTAGREQGIEYTRISTIDNNCRTQIRIWACILTIGNAINIRIDRRVYYQCACPIAQVANIAPSQLPLSLGRMVCSPVET